MGVFSEPLPIVPVSSPPLTASVNNTLRSPSGVSMVQLQLPSIDMNKLLCVAQSRLVNGGLNDTTSLPAGLQSCNSLIHLLSCFVGHIRRTQRSVYVELGGAGSKEEQQKPFDRQPGGSGFWRFCDVL